ncbi:hypothetical protein GGS21DRAFT_509253 [Xylaria nigripes]|nr:hypothetical protein GGS21DRAFT_509253 [Xylaria nigripes]
MATMASLLPRAALLPRGSTIRMSAATITYASPIISRLYSSEPKTKAQPVPPESPFFINVPNPPQDQSIEKRRELGRVRGFLPIPRRIFAHRDSYKKPTEEWLDAATRKPSKEKRAIEPASELQAWRRKMADIRRKNLRAGVRALWKRKKLVDEKRLVTRSAKLAANKAAAMAPEREDERLTRGTINAGTLQTAVILDPQRFKRAKASAERTAAIIAYKSETRRDALQNLYMKAQSFIVDAAELEAVVEKEFADDYFDKAGASSSGRRAENIWDIHGEPDSVASMMQNVQRSSNNLMTEMAGEKALTERRQATVAEELTGGKMGWRHTA